MFNSLYGTITKKNPQTLHLETGSEELGFVEWDFLVSDCSLDVFPCVGSKARVYVWLYHKEDGMRLFGFASEAERSMFFDLVKVDGVGPKAAIKILSSIDTQQLVNALESEDLSRLESISGIGKKTAQKMLLTLKGKLTLVEATSKSQKSTDKWQDVCDALVQMGYDKKSAEEALHKIEAELNPKDSKAAQEEFLFRRAIVELAN
ncbi:MAG: Holliday junction branch migration protein RuvA [Treponemataceae bacterium]